jgi:acyl-CoA dehydrogenase
MSILVPVVLALVLLVFFVPPLRRTILSRWIMGMIARVLPRIGDTEREALEAGTVWFDGEFFSGKPNWDRILSFTPAPLSKRERAFVDGPVEELCHLVREWDVVQLGDLSPEAWDLIRREKFFGMIIPGSMAGWDSPPRLTRPSSSSWRVVA